MKNRWIKKIGAGILAAAMTLGLCACGGSTNGSTEISEAAAVWPNQAVTVICPGAAGGGTDMILQLVDEYFTQLTGQGFDIKYYSDMNGYELARRAEPDGYNFVLGSTTIFTTRDDERLGFDYTDFEMVAFNSGVPNTCIAVRSDSEYQSFTDIVTKAAADPSSVTGGIGMSGQPFYFEVALDNYLGDILNTIDTGTAAERNAALLEGKVDYIITNYLSVSSYVDSKEVRVIAMDGHSRYELAPSVPTLKEQGIDFAFVAQPVVWLAPKGTDAGICEAFNQVLIEIYRNSEFISRYEEELKGVPGENLPIKDSLILAEEYKRILKTLDLY